MAKFQTNPWDLDHLLAQLDLRKIVLPEFQRSFVWRPIDIDLLITSIVQDYPAGSLLFLRAGAGAGELAYRAVEGVEENGNVTPDYLVLDGQQRLTSLSLALNGRGEHLFFMDLMRVDDGDFDNGIFPLRRDYAKARGLLHAETQWERHTYPISAAMGVGEHEFWFEDYVEFHVGRGASRDESRARARRWQREFVKPLKEYAFPVVELPSDTSLEAVCQIFETLNKTGMKLTVFDLLTAKFWPQGINLREMLITARSEYPLLGGDGFDVDATYLLQAIALLRSGLCKRSDLLELSPDSFDADWARVCRAASQALTVLRSECGVLTNAWLPYAALFPALFAIATKIQELHGPAVGAAWEKVKRWFWCSCFGQRYDGPPNTLNARDVQQLAAWIADEEQVPEAVRDFTLAELGLRRTERQRAALYRAVICLTVVTGARDFHTGHHLTPDVLADPERRIEDHHLFPTGFLKKQTPARAAENSVLNRCLIDNKTNKVISDKPPSQYLKDIRDSLGSDLLEEVLETHLIPTTGPGALENDDLDAFIDAREKLVVKAIAAVTGAPLHALEAAETYLDPSRPFTNELALRRVIRSLHGDVFWYEQHMSRKVLELLVEEIDRETVREIRLLSGPANVQERTKRAFERFRDEMLVDGVDCEWRVMPTSAGKELHVRAIFDDTTTWELPPLNSLLAGTVESIRPSQLGRERFEEAWQREDVTPILEFTPHSAAPRVTPAPAQSA